MTDKPKASPSLGLEISSNELKGAYLVYKNSKPTLESVFSIAIDQPVSTELHVKPLYTEKGKDSLHPLLKKSLITTSIPAKEVLVRQLTLPLVKRKDIDAVIEFQAEPLLPYPIEECFLDKIILQTGSEKTKLTIVAAKIEQISLHLQQWHSINIEPEVISCAPAGLAAFSELFCKTELPYIHINIGSSETTCILLKQGKLLAAQTISNGLDKWIECITKDTNSSLSESSSTLNTLNFSEISEDTHPSLNQNVTRYRLEITRVVYALRKLVQGEYSNDLFITGEGALIKGAPESIFRQFQSNIILPESSPEFPQTTAELQKYAIPIGTALTTLPKAKNQINFRQKQLSYPNPWKRIKQPMTAYFSACIFLALALYFFGNAYIAYEEDLLKKEYLDVLTFMKIQHEEFEKELRNKGIIEDQQKNGVEFPVIYFTQDDLHRRLNFLEKEIRATPDMFPLYPNTPRVSDVLAWLSTHPHIADENDELATNKPRIQLESFSYKMVKRPEQTKKRERYQVKVEIEFSTLTPRYAREFHDILLAPNDIVDPKGDVKWSTERGKYRASFFLKDKTVYPTVGR